MHGACNKKDNLRGQEFAVETLLMPDMFLNCSNSIRSFDIAARRRSKVLVVVNVLVSHKSPDVKSRLEKATRCIEGKKGERDFIYVWQNEAIVGPLS